MAFGPDDVDETFIADCMALHITGTHFSTPRVRSGSLRALLESVEPLALPRCAVGIGSVPGRSGTLFVQQEPFPGEALPRAA